MPKLFRFLTLMLILAVSTVRLESPLAADRVVAAQWEQKVDPWVLQTATEEAETEFLVFLSEQADLSAVELMHIKHDKGKYVYETLSALAGRTQKPVIAQLEALGVEYRPFWVANMIWVRGNLSVAQSMARRADVAHVFANPVVPLEALPEEEREALLTPGAVEWNIAMVNADDVWAEGVTGQGAVIGGHDTGYHWDHPALINQYRGWDGASANHNYNWHDAIHSGGGSCGPDSPEPCDDHGHGTHTMGTMIGDDGGTNQIGMAPGAQWIGCRNMDQGNGTPVTYSECYQWFIAPTDLNGENPDPSKAPDVINNSWSCPASEGCTDPNALLAVVQAVRAAGILTAHSAGNSGAGCGTVNAPSAIYAESFTVGSTTNTDTMSGFSSRGPVTVDGSNRLKPDISAPGSSIRSSLRGGGYGAMSGTSMAAPHVAGLVGLLISANPALAGQVDLLEEIIKQTAVPVTVNPVQTCGGIPSTEIPNNTFGWGRIDAYAAYLRTVFGTLDLFKSASVDHIVAGSWLTYTLTVTNQHPLSQATGVVLTDVIPANTFFITTTLPHSFDGTTVQWEAASLSPAEIWTLSLVVQVNGDATGSVENLQYAVRSDQVATVSGVPIITPIETVSALLTPDRAGITAPGEAITYTHTLTNTGSIPDTYALSYTSSQGWAAVLSDSPTLNPGESTLVMVTLFVPAGTSNGTIDQLIFTTTSNTVPTVSASVTDTTTVKELYQLFFPFAPVH